MKYILTLLLFGFIFSCNSQKQVVQNQLEMETTNFDAKLKGKWVLDYMSPVNGKNFEELFKIQMPYLNFTDGQKVSGNNGCNNIAGNYNTDGKTIQFETDKFMKTRMYCEGFDESTFTGVLKTVNNYEIIEEGQKLVLLTSDIFSMTFVREE
ncbi:MAG: META domain-containing protein [Moheibacter sp.]